MQRYHKLLAGYSWMAEYGDPDTDDWTDYLHKYSPYHNLQAEIAYPPLLVRVRAMLQSLAEVAFLSLENGKNILYPR